MGVVRCCTQQLASTTAWVVLELRAATHCHLPFLAPIKACVLPLPHHPTTHHQMATMKQAEDLMNELTTVARPVSIKEDATLRAFARNATGDSSLQLKWWDNAYWAERQKEAKFRVKQEELRQYLPLPSVKAGLWQVRDRLRGGGAWSGLGLLSTDQGEGGYMPLTL